VIEATGGSGQGSTLSPMLYDFVEEFSVVNTALKTGTDRDCVHQYVDDIVPIAPTYEELETITSTLQDEFQRINFAFNHQKVELPE
jgi:hypothetical protein